MVPLHVRGPACDTAQGTLHCSTCNLERGMCPFLLNSASPLGDLCRPHLVLGSPELEPMCVSSVISSGSTDQQHNPTEARETEVHPRAHEGPAS